MSGYNNNQGYGNQGYGSNNSGNRQNSYDDNEDSQERGLFSSSKKQQQQPQQGYGSQQPGPQQGYGRQQQYQAGPQQGNAPSNYGSSAGGSQHGGRSNMPGNDYSQEEVEKDARNAKYKDWAGTAGKVALGALAAGAAAYGVHEYKEHREEKREEREEEERRKQNQKYNNDEGKWNNAPGQDNNNNQGNNQGNNNQGNNNQGQQQQQQQQRPSQPSQQGGSGFRPPAPFGRPPYSYDQNDVRHADPSRNSQNSPTPHEYPQLRQNSSDTTMKIGTVLALKHNMTGRFLHTDRQHNTQTGSSQQLVFGYRWNPDQNDWWQVLPANRDVPVPGQIVTYGTQIRLRHIETGRHLHSHYNYHCSKSGQNEVTAYGDSNLSDENDHWVIERWGDGGYGQTWSAGDVVVLRHYVSGMALHSHDLLYSEDVQSVTCFGPGGEENDKWRVHLTA